MKLLFITLGCPKNTVDSERMLYLLTQAGYEPTVKADDAEVAVINTCAFLESAREEAIDHILAAAAFKKTGRLHTLVVAGCLSQLVQNEIYTELPEVDGVIGCGRIEDVVEQVNAAVAGQRPLAVGGLAVKAGPRTVTTGPATAYLKISEGCDNHCAYCLIPSIRGPFRSVPMEELIASARALADGGIKELIVVSQDTTRYGQDLYGESRLCALLNALCEIDGLRWIRLHYLYPALVGDDLIELVASQPKIVKYLDIPIQHADDAVLAAMNRRDTHQSLDALFTKLRARIPDLVLRTTVMTGFPGESDEAFDRLYAFMAKHEMARAGVFTFSPEEGTPAAARIAEGTVPPVDAEKAQARAEALQLLQADIQDSYHQSLTGLALEVLCEGYDPDTRRYFGRTAADSPEVDSQIYFTGSACVPAGSYVSVRVTHTAEGCLYGELILVLEASL